MAHQVLAAVAVHLDHGAEASQVRDALAAGFSSVMFDGSKLPFDENAALTKYSADYAHAVGASCEGEIGHVAMGDESAITTVEDAVKFYDATKVDALAVSVGTVHGFYTAEPKIEVGRCREIADAPSRSSARAPRRFGNFPRRTSARSSKTAFPKSTSQPSTWTLS